MNQRFDHSDGVPTGADTLIVGAGPTGLAAALFLAERGIGVQIVEKRTEPSGHSKAFGVNGRTLELLESTGVTARLLESGWRMQALNMRRGNRLLGRVDFAGVNHRYPFMLVHSQAKTERLLEEALDRRGVRVERGTAFAGMITPKDDDEQCAVSRLIGDQGEHAVRSPHLLGADGADSAVRQAVGIDFDGDAYPEPWRLYDIELDLPLPRDEAHVLLLDDGAVFTVRLEDDVWRVLGNVPDLLSRLPKGTHVGEIVWQSDFEISNRLAARFQYPGTSIFLAGDAAHIHSGLGARGMNLGIEDAYVYAALAAENRLDTYNQVRRAVVAKVMREITRMTAVPRAQTPPGRVARALAPVLPLFFPLVRRHAATWILGLDHPVES